MDDLIIRAVKKIVAPEISNNWWASTSITCAEVCNESADRKIHKVLKISGNHWTIISTIGCEAPTVNDSMHGNLPKSTQRLVADLVQCQKCAIIVHYIDMQWQSGRTDSGIFALAFATSLCSGQNPTATSYN